jgi:hypothetical protein
LEANEVVRSLIDLTDDAFDKIISDE